MGFFPKNTRNLQFCRVFTSETNIFTLNWDFQSSIKHWSSWQDKYLNNLFKFPTLPFHQCIIFLALNFRAKIGTGPWYLTVDKIWNTKSTIFGAKIQIRRIHANGTSAPCQIDAVVPDNDSWYEKSFVLFLAKMCTNIFWKNSFQFCDPFSRNLSIFLSHLFCATL